MDTERSQLPNVAESRSGIKRTSINVPEDVWADLKICAIKRGMSATAAVEAALRSWIDRQSDVA